jgi:magnesium chelatase subunit I
MVFSANPEDYTNRGRIVTPLKDRIGSVVRTHYPLSRDAGIEINDSQAWWHRGNGTPYLPHFIKEIVEEAARLARTSPHVNQASGVSVRMSIANLENVVSNSERRALLTGESHAVTRPSDLWHVLPSSRGKLELSLSEDDGQEDLLIRRIVDEAIKNVFEQYFSPKDFRQAVEFFEGGKALELGDAMPSKEVVKTIERVPGLRKAAEDFRRKALHCDPEAEDAAVASVAEFILEGLHVNNRLNKNVKEGKTAYRR